jgi:hypothetical protein
MVMTEEELDLFNELVPKNSSLSSRPKRKKSASRRSNVSSSKASQEIPDTQTASWSLDIDPFENCNCFIRFYKARIRYKLNHNPDIVFSSHKADISFACEILDIFVDKSGIEDKRLFLQGWIDYYARRYLLDDRKKNPAHTSLRAFKNTFDEYNRVSFL